MDEAVYFGRPGWLEKIQVPHGSLDGSAPISSANYVLASGGMRADRLLHARRTFKLSYNGLGYDSFETLAQYAGGHMGPGPFAFINPGQRNMLTSNQSSCGGQSNGTEGFGADSGVNSALSVMAGMGNHPSSIKWLFKTTNPAQNPTLYFLAHATEWYGTLPVVGRPHAFSAWVKGGVGSVTITPSLVYFDEGGNNFLTVTGTTTATVVGSWVQIKAESVVTPPSTGTAYIKVQIVAVSNTVTANEYVQVSHAMLNEGTTADPIWRPGTGVYPVMIQQQDDVQAGYDRLFRVNPNLVIQEIG